MSKVGWTQACCQSCWRAYTYGRYIEWFNADQATIEDYIAEYDAVVKLVEPQKELCVFCGQHTISGIFIRISPQLTTQADLGFFPVERT